MRVYLFDIDGTLIHTRGAGRAAMEAALQAAFGRSPRTEVVVSGRTDRGIGRDFLTACDLEPTDENFQAFCAAYLAILPHELERRGGVVLPGVEEVLDRLATFRGVALGLLTGNLREGARTKLRRFGLFDRFAFGGFGDDHADRDGVAAEALARAEATLGRAVPPADVWVVGDTPLDVRCARAIGARSLAVATGLYSLAELARWSPDRLVEDLSDVEEFLTLTAG